MDKFFTGVYNLLADWIPSIWLIAAIALVVVGAGCLIPSEKVKSMCRSHIAWVIIGVGVVICSTAIAKEVSAAWAF